jgi:hypothetical protein
VRIGRGRGGQKVEEAKKVKTSAARRSLFSKKEEIDVVKEK